MRKMRLPKHIVYGLISFACPVVAFIAILLYQSIVDSNFWVSLIPEESAAGALMAISEVVQVVLFSMGGCLVGLIFGILSIRIQRRVLGVGMAAIVFNALPFLLLMSFWIKGMTVGL
jgi:hypothetical protein